MIHRILPALLLGSALFGAIHFSWGVGSASASPAEPALVLGAQDSSALHRSARDAQAEFERTRIRYAPRTFQSFGEPCDERVGRMCVRIMRGTEDGWTPPPEDERISEARRVLIERLDRVGEEIPGDVWLLGQRVAYMGEAGEWERARALAEACGLDGDLLWWCSALTGTAAHFLGHYVEAEQHFARALERMPEDLARDWRDVTPIVEPGLQSYFRNAEGDSLSVLEARLWMLADPLFLVPGNDHWTEHLARHALARIRGEARNPYGMQWGRDLAEILVRYGPEVAFQQQSPPSLNLGPTPVVGRFNPRSRGFLPVESHFLDPPGIPEGSWTTDERGVRGRHAPAYSPRVGMLEIQQARFRRGDDLLLVLGWRLGDGEPSWEVDPTGHQPSSSTGAEGSPGSVGLASVGLASVALGGGTPAPVSTAGNRPGQGGIEAGLFLVAGLGSEPNTGVVRIEATGGPGGAPSGSASALVPSGRYLLSLELLDPSSQGAWRARHGVTQDRMPREVVTISDLLLLDPGVAHTGSSTAHPDERPVDPGARPGDRLEAHFSRVLPARRVEGDLVEVAWEVYGLSEREGPMSFRLSATPEERGLLRRAGELLGLLQPQTSVEVAWQEMADPDRDGGGSAPYFRRVVMDLGSLPSGPVRLTLSLGLPGRTETTTDLLVERID